MKIKSLGTGLRRSLAILCSLLILEFAVKAQTQQEPLQPQLVTQAPTTGTFYLLHETNPRPYPFDPYFGQLPIFLWNGVFFVDDAESFELQQAQKSSGFSMEGGPKSMSMMSGGAPGPPGIVGTNAGSTNFFCHGPTNFTVSYRYSTNGLSLGITLTTNNGIHLLIDTDTTNAVYDLFATTNLTRNATGWNQTNWTWLLRTTPGTTTNFIWSSTNVCEALFQLGTMIDDDLDGLTTAYEILVSHTKWDAGDGWDSDGDGLSDGDELRFTLTDPNNPDTGNTGVPDGYKDPDGDGWTHIDEMRNTTDPLVFNTPAPVNGVTVQLLAGETNVIVAWGSANGPVTGYTIRDQNGNVVATVSAASNEVRLATSTFYPWPWITPTYSVQAIYANGLSEISSSTTPGNLNLAIQARLLLGQNGHQSLAIAGLSDSVESVLLFFAPTFSGDPPSSASISRSNFVGGLYQLSDNLFSEDMSLWAQARTLSGEVSPITPVGV